MDLESQLSLERDLPPAEEFLATVGGRLVRLEQDVPGTYWAILQPQNQLATPFTLRMIWAVYPHRAPSLHFAVELGGPTSAATSWPAAEGYRAPNDVCKSFTAEGQQLHPEWGSGPHAWRATGNPLLYVLETVQRDIDRTEGRRAE
jgi:hypothetical protein